MSSKHTNQEEHLCLQKSPQKQSNSNEGHERNESFRHQRHCDVNIPVGHGKLARDTSLVRSVASIIESIHSCEDLKDATDIDQSAPDRKVEEKTEGKYEVIVLMAAFCVSILLGMNWIAFPVFYVEFSEYFGQSKFVTGLIGSVQNALSQLLHLIISAPIQVYGCRPVAMLGGVLLCTGYAMSCFAPSIPYLYLTYGVIGGIGQSMLNLPCSVIVQQHFSKNRSLAASIVMTGRAVGQIIGPVLIPYLIEQYSWKGAILIYGGIILNCAPLAIFFFMPKHFKPKKTGLKLILQKMVDFSLFKHLNFVCFCTCFCLVKFNVFGFFHHLPNRMVFYGYSKTSAALLLTVASSASLVGRLLFGIVGNFKCTDRSALFTSAVFISGICTVLIAFVTHYMVVAVLSGIYGAFQGTIMLMINIVLIDHFGVELFARSRGLLNVFSGAAGLVATPFAGWLFDVTQNYNIPFIVTGGLGLLGGMISLASILVAKVRTKNKTEQKD